MTKLLLCGIIIILCGVIGYGISNSYINRKKFFISLDLFLSNLKIDISFSAKRLQIIIKESLNVTGQSSNFKKLLSNYLNCLENLEITEEKLFLGVTILSTEEMNTIYHFFNKLGKLDCGSQMETIKKMKETNCIYLNMAQTDAKKYCSLFVKLGVIVGCFISILIL